MTTRIRTHGHDPRGVDGDRRWNITMPPAEEVEQPTRDGITDAIANPDAHPIEALTREHPAVITQTRTIRIDLTPQELATIQVALANETEHANDAVREADDVETRTRMGRIYEHSEALWQRLSRVR